MCVSKTLCMCVCTSGSIFKKTCLFGRGVVRTTRTHTQSVLVITEQSFCVCVLPLLPSTIYIYMIQHYCLSFSILTDSVEERPREGRCHRWR
jgi:hypothetical protein